MRKYLLLYSKRILRILPFAVLVAAILFGSLAAIFGAAKDLDENSGLHVKFQLGVVGTTDDKYLSLGLAAFQSMDSSRFSVTLTPMTEEQAQEAILSRRIAAYIVFPDGFMDAAMRGELIPMRYVSTAGAPGIVTLLKDEITQIVESIFYESQRCIYGVGDALDENGLGDQAGKHVNDLSIEYISQILKRGKIYSARELGISDGLNLTGYLITGLSVLFLLLMCMPYAPLMIRPDRSAERMLASKGLGAVKQIFAEFTVYFFGLLILTACAVAAFAATGALDAYSLGIENGIKVMPAVLCVAAWSYLCYEISPNTVAGVLLQFLGGLAMAFVCGCMYPAYFFPEALQKLGAVLPAGAARLQFAGCLTGTETGISTVLLLGYTGAFLLLAVLVRMHTLRSDRR